MQWDVVLPKACEQIHVSGKGQREVALLPVHFLDIAKAAAISVSTGSGPPGILRGSS